MRGSSGWGRSGAGDGRSVFHSRVGYRMNAFRRGLASDLVGASAHDLPTGLSRMSLTFHSAPGLTGQALDRVRARVPGPWTARPLWSIPRWLRERPGVSILTAAASAEFGVSTLDQFRIRLTIHRSVERATASCRIDFEQAVLTLIQDDRQGQRRLRLVPVQAGGFLALPLAPRRSDSVVIDFVPTTLPLPSASAPDLHKPFALELRSVHAEIRTRRPMSGRLPIAALVIAPPA